MANRRPGMVNPDTGDYAATMAMSLGLGLLLVRVLGLKSPGTVLVSSLAVGAAGQWLHGVPGPSIARLKG